MSEFSKAISLVLKHEGLYSDNPNDPGGPTMYGISLRFLKGLGDGGDLNNDGMVDINDIKEMELSDAMRLYYDNFWNKYHYERASSQPIATKIFDLSVNMGAGTAHKLVQTAINRILIEKDKLKVDGILGTKSFNALNGIKPGLLMEALCSQAEKHYDSLVIKYPDLKPFLKGWHNRAQARCGL